MTAAPLAGTGWVGVDEVTARRSSRRVSRHRHEVEARGASSSSSRSADRRRTRLTMRAPSMASRHASGGRAGTSIANRKAQAGSVARFQRILREIVASQHRGRIKSEDAHPGGGRASQRLSAARCRVALTAFSRRDEAASVTTSERRPRLSRATWLCCEPPRRTEATLASVTLLRATGFTRSGRGQRLEIRNRLSESVGTFRLARAAADDRVQVAAAATPSPARVGRDAGSADLSGRSERFSSRPARQS